MRPRARHLTGVGLVVLAAAVGVAVWQAGGDDATDQRHGSADLGDAEPLPIERTPSSYRIDYRVEARTGGEVNVHAERLTVHRPFSARLDSYDGGRTSGEPARSQLATFGLFGIDTEGGDKLTVAAAPTVPPGDVRIEALADEAVELGLLERREHRRVLGRRCQVLRSSGPLGAEQLLPAGGEGYVDSCVDIAGLLLEEVVVRDGAIAARRIATEVTEGIDVDEAVFDPGPRNVPDREGGGVVRQLTPDSRLPDGFWQVPDPPLPWQGRYAVVPPQVEAFTDASQRNRLTAFVVDVFAAGPDLVTVEQGGTLGGVDILPELPEAPTVDVGALGSGTLALTGQGVHLQIGLEGGRFVRLVGTVHPDVLVDLARSLRPVPGGELTVVRDISAGDDDAEPGEPSPGG